MATAKQSRERQDRILAELSELGLALARDLQARALAADDAAEASELGLAFHRVARAVRQTLALEARLERDHQRAEREVSSDARRAETDRADRRRAQIKFAVERCVFSEADGPEAERLLDELDDQLEEGALSDAFADEDPIDAHIARICAELGVTPSSSPLGGGGDEADGGGFHSDLGGPPHPRSLSSGRPLAEPGGGSSPSGGVTADRRSSA